MSFNLFARSVVSLFDRLVSDHRLSYDAERDIVACTVSIAADGGSGRGAAKVVLTSDESDAVADVLEGFDPSREMNTAEIIAKSLQVIEEEDGNFVCFRMSNQKHARTVKVSVTDWADFVRFVRTASTAMPKALEAMRKEVKSQEETE